MQSTLQAIVIASLKYKENGLIVKFLTKEQGLIAVVCHGIRKGKRNQSAYFSHLNICEITISHKNENALPVLKEIKTTYALSYCRSKVEYGPLFIYIAGMLKYVLHENQTNTELFNWLSNWLQDIEHVQIPVINIPIHYTISLLNLEGLLANPNQSFELSTEEKELYNNIIEICKTHKLREIADANLAGKNACLSFIINALAYNMQNAKIKELYSQILSLYA